MKNGYLYSFENAIKNLSVNDYNVARDRIKERLGITTDIEWYRRKKNWKNIPKWCYDIVTEELGHYGLTEDIIWDIKEL